MLGECKKRCHVLCTYRKYKITQKISIDKNVMKQEGAVVNFKFAKKEFAMFYNSVPKMTLFDLFYKSCSLASFWLGLTVIGATLKMPNNLFQFKELFKKL